jgi:hypothetical protein
MFCALTYHYTEAKCFINSALTVAAEQIQRSLAQCRRPECPSLVKKVTAHALDASVVLRATISVPELRPKSVPMQFILATDVAKALAEQLPITERTAELQKLQGG